MIFKSYQIEQNITNLKSKLVLFYGENLGLKNDFKNKIKQIYKKAYIKNFSQEEVLSDQENFFNEIYNESLFEENSIFFINQVNDKLLKIVEELDNKTNKKIYLFSEILDKKSKLRIFFEKSKQNVVVACYTDNDIALRKIILENLNEHEGLTPEIVNVIIDNCNLDRSKLRNELTKISAYFDNKKIEKRELEILLNIKENNNFNVLKDEALNGNLEKTNKLIQDTIIEADKNILYINIINRRLLSLLEVIEKSRQTNIETAINTLKPPIFWKDKPSFMIQIKKWNINKIKNFLTKTYDLELMIKSNSSINHQLLIKKLIVDICVSASS